ncbi:helix-turn-helix domain-containing protein [Quadrisphaera setariae]|uniref:Helix-turn-helix transcriptional regulator n=1 Tax=Quadrisphaera setariae TaxID=2593304 RepID=A0A5C8Z6F8_9ACTN|nr:AraC family transcriptional regulator [Quadrisphaera setariae]TXR52873.1 helix-turn-helix transcriptional regulator [Quadrisphaera setariae]
MSPRVHVPPVDLRDLCEEHEHVLLWQVRGTSDVVVDGSPQELRHGWALWVPSGVHHSFTTHDGAVVLPTFFPAASTATTLARPTTVAVDDDLSTLLLAFVQSSYSIIRPRADLARQVLALLEEGPSAPTSLPVPVSGPARAVAEALRFNPGDERGVEELARSAHASARTVERSFLTETGMTLREWRIRIRMETAARLLRARTAPEAVAQRVGYTSGSAFRRVFKDRFGMTPSQYATSATRPGSALPRPVPAS